MANPLDATFVTQIPSGSLPREIPLSSLETGLLKSTKTTGTLTTVTAPAGTIVGTSDTQTLSNKTVIQKVTSYSPSSGETVAIDLTTGNVHVITMPSGNVSVTVDNETAGQCFLIEIIQDSGGSRTISSWFTTIKWAGGSAPTLTTTGSKKDVFGFRVTGTDAYYGVIVGQNI